MEGALQWRELEAQRERAERAESRSELFEVDPFLQIRPRPNDRIHVNADSFRGDPLDLSDDVSRVFTLGGSSTFEWRLPYEDTYPAKLERRLAATPGGKRVQLQNAASDWYSTEHSVIRYAFHVRRLKPDVIIVMHAINDLFRSFAPEWFCDAGARFRPDYSHYLGAIVRVARPREAVWIPFRESLLLRTVRRALGRAPVASPGPIDAEAPDFARRAREEQRAVGVREFPSLSPFRDNLRLFATLARADGVSLILATQPNVYGPAHDTEAAKALYFGPVHCGQGGEHPDYESLAEGLRRFNRTVLEVGAETGTPVVDLEAAVPKDFDHFRDDVHVTAKTTEIEARLLEPVVRAALRARER